MIARLRAAWILAKALDADSLEDLYRLLRIHGVPVAARLVAQRHEAAIRRRLELDLGHEPSEHEMKCGVAGFVGGVEGLT